MTLFIFAIKELLKVDKYPLPTTEEIFASLTGRVTGPLKSIPANGSRWRHPKRSWLSTHTKAWQCAFLRACFWNGINQPQQFGSELLYLHVWHSVSSIKLHVIPGWPLHKPGQSIGDTWKSMALYSQQEKIFLFQKQDRDGIRKTQDKIEAAKWAPSPQHVSQLSSFLRLMAPLYYLFFLSIFLLVSLSTILWSCNDADLLQPKTSY